MTDEEMLILMTEGVIAYSVFMDDDVYKRLIK